MGRRTVSNRFVSVSVDARGPRWALEDNSARPVVLLQVPQKNVAICELPPYHVQRRA